MLPDAAISDPAYQSALRWLYGLSPNVRTAVEIVADHARKLARTRALLAQVGSPERRLQSVLVAGTKGKGSIAAFSESILRAARLKTGLVTSPHLMSWCERTRIEGADVDPATAARLLSVVRAAVERMGEQQPELGQPTTFEAGLAFSLLAFEERGVEIAVVECGVGGLHDATNVLDPLAVALGPISYDHMATLGPTLTAIATEKTGIFREGRLAVSGLQPVEALAVVERAAEEWGVRLERLGVEWRWQPEDDEPFRGRFTVSGPRGAFVGLSTPLPGRHQRENATVAVALATDILAALPTGGRDDGGRDESHPYAPAMAQVGARFIASCPDAAVREGLASVNWPGRLQALRERPWLVLDGAHNGDSAVRLAEALPECFPSSLRHLVLGTSVGKDIPRMLEALLPICETVTVTRSRHERSASLENLSRALLERGVVARTVPVVHEAIASALDLAARDDLVIVTGSLFVVGEALETYGAVS